jgi:hypothetical protein
MLKSLLSTLCNPVPMPSRLLRYYIVTAAVWFVLATTPEWCASQPPALPSDAARRCTHLTSDEFATWFSDGTVTRDGVVTPASVDFSEGSTTDPCFNSRFYEWAERMFLWLTSPAPSQYGGAGLIFDSRAFYEVLPIGDDKMRALKPQPPLEIRIMRLRAAQVGMHGFPVIMDTHHELFEIEPTPMRDGEDLVADDSGDTIRVAHVVQSHGKPVFLDNQGKPISGPRALTLDQATKARTVQKFGTIPIFINGLGDVINVEPGQAGFANGAKNPEVLAAQNGSLIFYRTVVNDVFACFMTREKNAKHPDSGVQFPTTATELTSILDLGHAHGISFPDANALVVEVKTSWIEASSLSNVDQYITLRGTIPTYDTTDPNHWKVKGQKATLLALVGMHVVGTVRGHPEMVWATFEHREATPDESYSYTNSSNSTTTVPRNTNAQWLFSATNASEPFNVAHMFQDDGDIVAISNFTVSPSNTLRSAPWGALANKNPNPLSTSAVSNAEILAINNMVHDTLADGDVRGNYLLRGATWTAEGKDPSLPGTQEVGTSKLASSTMETYQVQSNCFRCHTSNHADVSHVYQNLKPLF